MKTTKNNKTLLEQVKEKPTSDRLATCNHPLDVDVALAWLRAEVRQVQISKTLWPNKKSTNTTTLLYCFLNRSLREAYRQGRIKIVE